MRTIEVHAAPHRSHNESLSRASCAGAVELHRKCNAPMNFALLSGPFIYKNYVHSLGVSVTRPRINENYIVGVDNNLMCF